MINDSLIEELTLLVTNNYEFPVEAQAVRDSLQNLIMALNKFKERIDEKHSTASTEELAVPEFMAEPVLTPLGLSSAATSNSSSPRNVEWEM